VDIRRVVPDVATDRPEESREFYTKVLGFDLAMDMGWIMTFVSPTHPTAQINVLRSDATAQVSPAVSVEVADADAVHAIAVARGLDIVHPLTTEPWGVRRFFVRDPNGVVINVMQHSKPGEPR